MGRTDHRFSNESGVAVVQAKASSAVEAAAEIARQLPRDGLAIVIVFCSPCYDPHEFAAEIAEIYGPIPVYGCTTMANLRPEAGMTTALSRWDLARRTLAQSRGHYSISPNFGSRMAAELAPSCGKNLHDVRQK